MLSHFFIDRPIFATVISIVIVLVGAVAVFMLPIAQYPEVAPPTVQVSTSSPGSNAREMADTVASPIDLEVNGVEDMLYMSAKTSNDGQLKMDVTFELGTDLDEAQVLVQNRVSVAEAKLPEEAKRQGVTTKKRSPNMLLLVHLISAKEKDPITSQERFKYDLQYLSTYATTQIKDELARIKGVGDASVLGARDVSMRIWLDPPKLAARDMVANDVVRAIREQNVQVAAGRLGQPPTATAPAFQLTINTLGRLTTETEFGEIVVKTGDEGEPIYLRDLVREDVTLVTLDPKKLASKKLSAQEVIDFLRSRDIDISTEGISLPEGMEQVRFKIKSPVQNVQLLVVKATEGEDPVVLDEVLLDNRGVEIQLKGIELAAKNYDVTTLLDGEPMATIALYQQPGANAVETAQLIRAKMEELALRFPQGLEYKIVYDTTVFIEQSIYEVYETLFIAIALVFLVVLLFLQNWRATIIPMVAVPVSLIGTFAVLAALGYSLNNLSLFGLVLAIGIVVDDAIVVVENVDRNLAQGMNPREATRLAMTEITGPVVATTLVMLSVFLPCIFMAGIVGQFFRQFAVTIAISTLISSINALTMSPALCALLLRPSTEKKDWLTRGLDFILGWFFRGFNAVFDWAAGGYGRTVSMLLRVSAIALLVYGGFLFLTYLGFTTVPAGFIPPQDKGYLIINAQLPDGASSERTDAVMAELNELVYGDKGKGIEGIPGVQNTIDIRGYSLLNGSNLSNVGSMFIILEPFEKRGGDSERTANQIAAKVREKLASVRTARVSVFGPPPVDGIGTTGGFKMQVKDDAGLGLEVLQQAVNNLVRKGNARDELVGLFTSFSTDQPQLFVNIDRIKAKRQKVDLSDIFNTLQVYLGSLYVNDLTLYNRNWQVIVQANSPYRMNASDIGELKVRNANGGMVPLNTLITVTDTSGPALVTRYNTKPSAEIVGNPGPGTSSGQAIALMEELAKQELPPGISFEWTELTLQQKKAGEDLLSKLAFPLAVLFVFLVLAAQYESWSLPLAIILIVPMCMLCAVAGILIAKMDNNVFTQIGLIVLVGLSAKNAILIVEFAKQKEDDGLSPFDASVEAAQLRLRPILMTAFSFILGVIPLLVATGAGSEMRIALGVAVFSGMLGVTIFGLFLTPVFYFVIRWFASSSKDAATEPPIPTEEPEASPSPETGIQAPPNVTDSLPTEPEDQAPEGDEEDDKAEE